MAYKNTTHKKTNRGFQSNSDFVAQNKVASQATQNPPPFQFKKSPPFSKNKNTNFYEKNIHKPPIQGVFGDAKDGLLDAFNMRDNEAGLDAYEDYQDAIKEKTAFKGKGHRLINHMPSTGRGKFNAFYLPNENKLLIAVTYDIKFLSGSKTDYPHASEDDLKWKDDAKATWESKMQSLLYNQWSNKFVFYCQKDYWEEMSANTKVVFYRDDAEPHYNFEVTKIPKYKADGKSLAFRGSAVTPPSKADEATRAKLDSNDIESYDKLKTGKNKQTPIVHEAGHMLGLGDEYPTKSGSNYTTTNPNKMKEGYAHEHLADEMCDVDVKVGKDKRIMSSGDKFNPEHGVTFLEALRKATNMTEWDYKRKAPKAIPANPKTKDMGDFPVPKGDTKYA